MSWPIAVVVGLLAFIAVTLYNIQHFVREIDKGIGALLNRPR